ncbi:tRNA methyl transferase PRC-barrel domain-containing protein [Empedobacter brevis]|uniref:tRNA methyl transferase PRC-barrel domain-containing protein n=1 Tax=Empedobacter brevis TaxID=247 RepID=UPI0023F05DC5|nr:tRNA methyl transferase PRC-barrel domain-containing protein [Empedobacter brevis]
MKIGQIVEIPRESPIYLKELPSFQSKEEELFWKIEQRNYSLFDGFIVGEHQGIENFEIGQRKGINVSGKEFPVYVIGMDELENRLFVGQGKNHPGLFTNVLYFTERNINWVDEPILKNMIEVEVTSSQLEYKMNAIFFRFGKNYFLEFKEQILLIIKNYTMGLSYENKNVLILNK